MRIMFINPNSTHSMTEKVLQSAQAVVPSGVEVVARTNESGPSAIQGVRDGELALPGLVSVIEDSLEQEIDVFVVACFDDTGLEKIQSDFQTPVLGIGQAAFHASALLGKSFSVVTTLSEAVPVIESNIHRYGMSGFCRRVRASDVPVLELESAGSDAEERISDEIERALLEDNCDAIVLGCAGMTDLVARLQQRHGVPVIDGVVAAAGLASGLAFGLSGVVL